ncbi:MAG: SsrA-binding protein SmpB [Schleiferiaceae bacterium]|jgi:SsrA-binding protein|nr:SsrA-binding protein SmpB [Schleiferiaceae bacterium]
MQNTINISNKRARYEYELLDQFTAGLQLLGTEIKSIRQGKAKITDSFCFMQNGEMFIRNMHVAEYDHGNINNHNPLRERKLLLKRDELKKCERKLKDKGLTIVALKLFINEQGFAKLNIAIAKGKKLHDKRDSLKEKDQKREAARAKNRY